MRAEALDFLAAEAADWIDHEDAPLRGALQDDFAFTEGPCDFCAMRGICKAGLACVAFEAFVALKQWRDAPREPTQDLYGQIFGGRKRRCDAVRAAA